MTVFNVTVEYEVENPQTNATLEEEFLVEADGVQMAKYFYHKYTHDNYANVSRSQEDDHIHGVGDSFKHSIKEITRTDYAGESFTALRRL